MSYENASNASDSQRTSSGERGREPERPSERASESQPTPSGDANRPFSHGHAIRHDGESEAHFLLRQQNEAKAAFAHTISEMGRNLSHAVDVRLWTKDHPWAMLAAAAVGGFAAAAALVPSEQERALNKLRKIEEALGLDEASRRARKEKQAAGAAGNGQQKAEDNQPGFMATLAKEAIGMIKPIVGSVIAASMSAQAVQQQQGGDRASAAASHSAGMGAGFGSDPNL